MCQRSKYRHVFFHSSRVFFAFSSVKSLIKKQDSFFGKQTEAGFMKNISFHALMMKIALIASSEFKHLFFNPFPAKCQFVFQIETS